MEKLRWTDSRCVVCTLPMDSTHPLRRRSNEHIIPEVLGGKLHVDFLCVTCNSQLGTIEANWKSDPLIRFTFLALCNRIPELAAKLDDKQTYVVKGLSGTHTARRIDGKIRVDAVSLEDGSRIHPTETAPAVIKTSLRRKGVDDIEIAEAIHRLHTSPDDELIPIDEEFSAAKWSISEGNRSRPPDENAEHLTLHRISYGE